MTEQTRAPEAAPTPLIHRERFFESYRRGFLGTRQIAMFPFIFGVLFMTAALSRGFTAVEGTLMTVTVFAGSVLFACMELWTWTEPLPYFAIAVTSASVGCRHILMGLTLPPHFNRHVRSAPLFSLFFLTDINWLLTTKAKEVPNRFAYFLGSSTMIYGVWVFGAVLGLGLAELVDATTIQATRSVGAIFIALVLIMYSKGFHGSRLPWLAAACASGAMALYSVKLAVMTGVGVGAIVAILTAGKRHA